MFIGGGVGGVGRIGGGGRRGGTPAPTPGASPTVFSTLPTVHYHPNSQTATLGAGDRVESCPDLRGLAALSAPVGAGPFQLTDGLGRKFWRFNGAEWAAIANSLTVASNRAFTIVAVMRVPHHRNTVQIINPRYASYTSDSVNVRANASIGYLRASVTSNSAAYLQGGNPAATTNATDCWKAIPGAELHVCGLASRTTANGGTRLYNGTQTCDIAQQSTLVTNYVGAVIGAQPATVDNSTAVVTSVNNTFDIYELAIFTGELGNTAADTLFAEAFANFGLSNFTKQIVCEGDSITDGVGTVLPVSPAWAGGLGSRLCEPGAMRVDAATRVINMGTSGNQVTNLVTKRDAAGGWASSGRIPGANNLNKVFVQIGRNDTNAGGLTGDQIYTDRVVPYLNTTTTGVLQRGWTVYFASNIGTGNTTVQSRLEAFRARIMDSGTLGPLAAFLNDCNANTGGAFEGQLDVVPLSEITVGGDTMLKTAADSTDTAAGYYDNDNTHLRVAGIDLMISGGDNANRGWASRV